MIIPTDEDYIETKLLKRGERTLAPVFRELADWIEARNRGVSVLNIRYELIAVTSRLTLPRLSVISESELDKKRFVSSDGNFDPAQQAAISAAFREILASRHEDTFDTHRLFVIFSAFEQAARVEANDRVTPEQIEQLQKNLRYPEIWKIRPSGTRPFSFSTPMLSLALPSSRASDRSVLRSTRRC